MHFPVTIFIPTDTLIKDIIMALANAQQQVLEKNEPQLINTDKAVRFDFLFNLI